MGTGKFAEPISENTDWTFSREEFDKDEPGT